MERRYWVTLFIVAFLTGIIFYLIGRSVSIRKEPPAKKALARIAIVIDDWGYNMRNTQLLDSIDVPITVAILPNLPFSKEIAQKMHSRNNREIILHMPMEPEGKKVRLEKDTLLTSMDEKKVCSLLIAALKTVPDSKGFSNHMGSKATQNRRLIRTIMRELKKRRLYFLDSIATPETICEKEAKKIGVKTTARDVFLDNIADRPYISSQLELLARTAFDNGSAIGIGHDRRLTLQVIKAKVAELENRGFEFVLVSQLAKKR